MINWLESFEQEWDLINPFRTVFEVYKEAMDTYIFEGKKKTRIKAVSYVQACLNFVDKLVKAGHVEIDEIGSYIFIDEFKDDYEEVVKVYDTKAYEKPHACALYVKRLVDRGLLTRYDKE